MIKDMNEMSTGPVHFSHAECVSEQGALRIPNTIRMEGNCYAVPAEGRRCGLEFGSSGFVIADPGQMPMVNDVAVIWFKEKQQPHLAKIATGYLYGEIGAGSNAEPCLTVYSEKNKDDLAIINMNSIRKIDRVIAVVI